MKSCDVFEGSNFQLPRNFIVVTGHSTMKLKEIHRSSTFAWSSSQSLPLLATGTVAGALDESFSNESHGQLGTWAPIDGHRTSLIEMRFIWELRRWGSALVPKDTLKILLGSFILYTGDDFFLRWYYIKDYYTGSIVWCGDMSMQINHKVVIAAGSREWWTGVVGSCKDFGRAQGMSWCILIFWWYHPPSLLLPQQQQQFAINP